MGQPPTTIRVGVIGGGFGKRHLQGYRSTENVEIVAFCQRTSQQAEAIAKEFSIPHVYSDYRELIAQQDLDAISIVAPPHLHHEIATAAFDQGLHVLCEKPLAMNAREAEAMLRKAQDAGRVHMTAFNHRYIPALFYMKELLDGAYIGKRILHAEARWFSESRIGPNLPHYWRHQKELAGFGIMGDVGVHVIDRLLWLIGDFERVWGDEETFVRERRDRAGVSKPVTVEDSFTLVSRFAGGASGCMRLSGVAKKSNYQSLEVYGDDGMLRFMFDRNVPGWITGELWGARGDTRHPERLEIPERYTRGLDPSDPVRAEGEFIFAHVTREFVNAIRRGVEASPSFADGLAAQRVLDAALKSAEEERWIAL